MSKISINIANILWEDQKEGLRFKTLYQESGQKLSLIEIAPNVQMASHVHPENEYVYVLQGTISDETSSYSAGTFFINERGSRHAPFTKADGCTLLVLWCGEVTY